MKLTINKFLTAVLCGIAVSVFISGAHEAGAKNAREAQIIRIGTRSTDLLLSVEDGRLYQNYLGEKFLSEDELNWNA